MPSLGHSYIAGQVGLFRDSAHFWVYGLPAIDRTIAEAMTTAPTDTTA
jgi:hypothetical protein